MPSFRKLSPTEILVNLSTPSARAQVAQAYDAYLADFAIGEYGRAELIDGERRDIVRSRLHAAARRRGMALRFRPGRGPLIFCVEAVPAVVIPTPPVGAPLVGAQRASVPPRPPRRRQTATERYSEMLPRWMREGQQSGRRDGGKRRQGR